MELKSYEQELSDVLAMMAATLKGASPDRKALAQAWLMVVQPSVEQSWLERTCKHFLLHATWFPTPAEFIERAGDLAERFDIEERIRLTREQIRVLECEAVQERRLRLVADGFDPDEPMPVECLRPLFEGLTAKMLPANAESTSEEQGS